MTQARAGTSPAQLATRRTHGRDVNPRVAEIESLRAAARLAGIPAGRIVLPTDVDVVLGRIRLHYLDWGNHRKPPILFLHGGGLTAHTYDLVCLALRHDYHCIALDQRGHGDSEWSPVADYGYSTHARDIGALIDHLDIRRLFLVGMSMGGLNAIKYAADNARRLAGLVLIDAGPALRPRGQARIRRFMSESQGSATIEEYVEWAMAFNPRRDRQLLRRSLLHNLRETPAGEWTWKWDPRARQSGLDLKAAQERRHRLWKDVERIACGTLVVRGAESDVFTADDAETLAARLPRGSWTSIPNAGHTVQGDNPAALVRELRRFLSTATVFG